MDRSRWIIFGFISVAIVIALVVTTGHKSADVSNIDPKSIITSGPIADHVFGNPKAKTIFIEYGDYQCPGCGGAYPNVKEVTTRYKDNLAFVFRNFPLTTIHPNALAAATAAESAGLQGKYFEMHDVLYENQNKWESATADNRGALFEGYARQLGLNIDKFNQGLTDANVQAKINRDRALGQKAGVDATPTFFLNGDKMPQDAWNSAASLDKTLRQTLTRAGVSLPAEEITSDGPAAE